MKNKLLLTINVALFSGVLLTACSNQVQNEPAAVITPVAKSMSKAEGVAHTHPANKCTNSVTHTHPNGANAHKHRYSCKSGAKAKTKKYMAPNSHVLDE